MPRGHHRKFCRCKQEGCGRVYYRDYVPYSLSNPVIWTHCGHSLGHRDYNLEDITEAKYHALRVKELRVEERKRLNAQLCAKDNAPR